MTRSSIASDDVLRNSLDYLFSVLIAVVCLTASGDGYAAEHPGETAWLQYCGICHTVGKGRLVGPDLAGVHDRRSHDWLMKFVKSSQTLIKEGDPYAVALSKEFSGLVMPDAMIPEAQIEAVLDYIKVMDSASAVADADQGVSTETVKDVALETGTTAAIAATAAAAPAAPAFSREDVILGQDLFQGRVRFQNGGPSCISCHHVKNDAIIGGGILAAELTSVFSKMGGPGVRAIITNAPFPVMELAYRNKPLAENEIHALVGFLQDADENHVYQQPRDYGTGLLTSGVAGSFLLFGFYSLLWIRRKRESVNQKIYDRQIKSS